MELMIDVSNPILNGQVIAVGAVIQMHDMKYVVCDMKNPITVVAVWDENPNVVYWNWITEKEIAYEIVRVKQLLADYRNAASMHNTFLHWERESIGADSERAVVNLPNKWQLSCKRGLFSYGSISDATTEIGIINASGDLTNVDDFTVNERTYRTSDGILAWVPLEDLDGIVENISRL